MFEGAPAKHYRGLTRIRRIAKIAGIAKIAEIGRAISVFRGEIVAFFRSAFIRADPR